MFCFHCIVLYCIVLYCIVLYCIAIHSIESYCFVLHSVALYCSVFLAFRLFMEEFKDVRKMQRDRAYENENRTSKSLQRRYRIVTYHIILYITLKFDCTELCSVV